MLLSEYILPQIVRYDNWDPNIDTSIQLLSSYKNNLSISIIHYMKFSTLVL